MSGIQRAVERVVAQAGYEIKRPLLQRDGSITEVDAAAIQTVAPYSMASQERLIAARDAAAYVARNNIPGAVVECGVWAGGATMIMASTLLENGVDDRDIYLFDTFEGMSEPTELDVDRSGALARDMMNASNESWCAASIEDVQHNLAGTGYPRERLHFVKGLVEETIPAEAPEQIALLRLDTDWYESTRHELNHLAPLIAQHGVLLIDDYGHWDGSRRAVDEWIDSCGFPVFLTRTDYSGRAAQIAR